MVMQHGVEKLARRSSDKLSWKVLGYLLDALVVILIALATWTGRQLFAVESRLVMLDHNQAAATAAFSTLQGNQRELAQELAKMREWRAETTANRFTAHDGREVWKEIAAIREAIARMALVEPPTWLIDRINMLENRLQNLENRANK